jgi:hypothetical protein
LMIAQQSNMLTNTEITKTRSDERTRVRFRWRTSRPTA